MLSSKFKALCSLLLLLSFGNLAHQAFISNEKIQLCSGCYSTLTACATACNMGVGVLGCVVCFAASASGFCPMECYSPK
eukprot:m.211313 g.211313  ORF g.211313 m.211313 type:complete len:79 (+) comp18119_c0_seq1:84-320(+)